MIGIPGSAAALYALALALDAAAQDADVRSLIDQGRAWVRTVQVPAGPATVHYRRAAAAFMRSWARHEEPDLAAELVQGAADLDFAAELHVAFGPRLD
jgi:hypothetical protein